MAIDPVVGTLGSATISGVAGVFGRKKQHKRTKELMGIQQDYTQQNMDKQHEQQYDMWKKTNYPAQREMMEQAGLSPALMYGMGGQGGATTGTGGAPSGGMGQAPMGDVGTDAIGGAMAMAQIENLRADSAKKKAEADKTAGVDTEVAGAQVLSLLQGVEESKAGTGLKKAQARYTELQAEVLEATVPIEIQRIIWTSKKALEDLQQAKNETYISNETMHEKVGIIEQQYIGIAIENEAKREGINLTKAQIGQISEAIQQGWASIDIQALKTDNDFKAAMAQVEASIQNTLTSATAGIEGSKEIKSGMIWSAGINTGGKVAQEAVQMLLRNPKTIVKGFGK